MTYRLPSLNTLRAFEAAARHLSFKTAASELGVTAGAVSQQVKKLENSLGVKLFRRLPQKLLLTEQGEIYLPLISKVFEELTEATETIAPKVNGKKFNIGICPKAIALLPANWPYNNESLNSYVRSSIQTTDLEKIWNNDIDCLIRLGGGSYGDLLSITIPSLQKENSNQWEFDYICKPGLKECRQTKAILEELTLHATSNP